VSTKKETVCVVGCGYMGTQIALHCAVFGHDVFMVDVSENVRRQAGESQTQELDRRVQIGEIDAAAKQEILARIHIVGDLSRAASQADLAIEAVPEDPELKRKIFADLDRICPPHSIIASNSSSIRIATIEGATARPENVLNAHFFPPVWQRPMVELMRGTRTSDQTIRRMREFAIGLELTPLIVQKESTGFLFNRVWRAIKKETLHLVNDGVATHEDVDRAWMIGLGTQIGPFGLMDMVGLDVVRDIELVYYGESGDESDLPPKLLLDKISRGDLGRKTGSGFYQYPNPAYLEAGWLKMKTDHTTT
jgi:3-hydroxybutyryl-CoA dehydrogenase